jgi:hypothetical protein
MRAVMESGACSRCGKDAAVVQAYSGRALCSAHLVRDVEARAKRLIRRRAGIRTGDRVGIAIGSDPYGPIVAAFLERTFGRRHDLAFVRLVSGPGEPNAQSPTVDIGSEASHEAALRLGCTVLVEGSTLDDRARDVLEAVLAGDSCRLAIPPSFGPLRILRPFAHIPAEEVRLYGLYVTGTRVPPRPEPRDPLARFAGDELVRHQAGHPSAPFALARVAEALDMMGLQDCDRC